ncbi:MAG: spondin domain-containing protein [Cyanobacteria bacterium P01_F01_bin.143]
MAQTQVKVTIENLAPDNGVFLTPFWVGFHNGNFDTYDRGAAISPAFERLVEDGNTAPLSEEFLASGNGIVDGTIAGLEGEAAGPIDPGETVTATFTLESTDATSRYFSYASMIIPSNDAFVANGDPLVREIFDADGNFLGAQFVIAGGQVLDGGSEVNDELPESTAFFGQAAPDTGVAENGVVTLHPGFIEGGRILSEDGSSNNGIAFTGADFTADGYQIARITIEQLFFPVTIVSDLDGAQEVDGGDPDASGSSVLTLNDAGDSLEYSLTVSGLDFGANGLIEGGAQTEDTSDDVTRLHIHNAARGVNGPVVFSLFDLVAPELGNEVNIQGNQDEDLEIVLNGDGSVTLTGVWEETDPASTALSEFIDEIRDGEIGEDLDLYWNIHTEEFPGGAIRGQLVIGEEELLDTPFTRFQNSDVPGTYVFAAGDEAENIRTNFTNFIEEGVAFNAAIAPDDELIPLFRLESNQVAGTFLYVGQDELDSINASPDFSDDFINQGVAFYVYGAGAGEETPFSRFQNSAVPGTYLYATGAEADNIRANFPGFIDEGVAFEAAI